MYVEAGGSVHQAVAYRHADAAAFFGDQGQIVDVSADWSRYVAGDGYGHGHDTLRVLSRGDDSGSLTVYSEPGQELNTARISADGSRLAVLVCEREGSKLSWWSVDEPGRAVFGRF